MSFHKLCSSFHALEWHSREPRQLVLFRDFTFHSAPLSLRRAKIRNCCSTSSFLPRTISIKWWATSNAFGFFFSWKVLIYSGDDRRDSMKPRNSVDHFVSYEPALDRKFRGRAARMNPYSKVVFSVAVVFEENWCFDRRRSIVTIFLRKRRA